MSANVPLTRASLFLRSQAARTIEHATEHGFRKRSTPSGCLYVREETAHGSAISLDFIDMALHAQAALRTEPTNQGDRMSSELAIWFGRQPCTADVSGPWLRRWRTEVEEIWLEVEPPDEPHGDDLVAVAVERVDGEVLLRSEFVGSDSVNRQAWFDTWVGQLEHADLLATASRMTVDFFALAGIAGLVLNSEHLDVLTAAGLGVSLRIRQEDT